MKRKNNKGSNENNKGGAFMRGTDALCLSMKNIMKPIWSPTIP